MSKGSFDHLVDAAHRGKPATAIQDLGVEALKGATAADAKHLDDAFGIESIRELADNRFVRAAQAVRREAADIGHDPGPDPDWSMFFAEAPLLTYQNHANKFRLDFGPIYYRGRLDGTARLLIVGQDPAANELIGHRAFVGASGQRLQGFLRRLGIRRDYVMVNTFLYPVFGQFVGELAALSQDPKILDYRNRFLSRVADQNELEAVITVGNAARDAVERWPGAQGRIVRHITHPSAQDHAALLANWNAGLAALRAVVEAEAGDSADPSNYGSSFTATDHEPIPRRDLPFGVPEWHGVGSHAHRARHADNSTDHKRIIWEAP